MDEDNSLLPVHLQVAILRMAVYPVLLLVFSVLCLLSIIHSLQVYYLLHNVIQARSHSQEAYHIGHMSGLPTTVDLQVDSRVLLQVEESVHFNYSAKEAPIEWSQSPPSGSGAFALPEDHRAVFVTTFHQIHCIETFAKELIILCRPDLTLEEGDFAERHFTHQKRGAIHACRNWENTRAVVNANSLSWISILEDGMKSNITE